MHYAIENLINGKQEIADHFKAARDHWAECLRGKDATDADTIASIASSEQMWFEQNCGGRYEGQEVMAWTGIAMWYTTERGFEHKLANAKAMRDGMVRSMCNVEIGQHAEDAAKSYQIDEYSGD